MRTLRGCLSLGGKPHFAQKQCSSSSQVSGLLCCFVLTNRVTTFVSWYWCLFSVTHTCSLSNVKFINQLVGKILSWEYLSRWEVKKDCFLYTEYFTHIHIPRDCRVLFRSFFIFFLFENLIFCLSPVLSVIITELELFNSFYYSYQRFWHANEASGSLSIVWTISLVCMQPQANEVLPVGPTVITSIVSAEIHASD